MPFRDLRTSLLDQIKKFIQRVYGRRGCQKDCDCIGKNRQATARPDFASIRVFFCKVMNRLRAIAALVACAGVARVRADNATAPDAGKLCLARGRCGERPLRRHATLRAREAADARSRGGDREAEAPPRCADGRARAAGVASLGRRRLSADRGRGSRAAADPGAAADPRAATDPRAAADPRASTDPRAAADPRARAGGHPPVD